MAKKKKVKRKLSDKFNLPESERLRDEGIELVTRNNNVWFQFVISFLRRNLPADFVGAGEDIRFFVLDNGIKKPKSPHAWGALIREAVKKEILVDLNTYRKMRWYKSHARRTPVYAVSS